MSGDKIITPPGSPIRRLFSFLWYGALLPFSFGLISFVEEAAHKVQKVDYEALPKRDGQVTVLTGASRGIGLDILKKLLQLNCHVILGVRTIETGLQAIEVLRKSGVTSGTAQCLSLDLKSLKSVREFAQIVLAENDRIDVLINNAGIMCVPYEVTEDGFESHFQVNYLSHFLLTQLLLSKLKTASANKSSCSRIINVSSTAHQISGVQNVEEIPNVKVYTRMRAYADSKLCQVLFTKYLDEKLKTENVNVRVYAVHPGIIPTGLYNSVKIVGTLMNKFAKLYRSSEEGADVVMYGVISPEIENMGGSYIHNSRITKTSSLSEDSNLQKALWALSECCIWVKPSA